MAPVFFSFALALSILEVTLADTPANCTVGDILGTWVFHEGQRGQDSSVQCSNVSLDQLHHPLRVHLLFPDVATDEAGNIGTWTIIYNQGFEVHINNRKYFTFSNYTQIVLEEPLFISRCHETKPGWAHDIYIRDWSCFIGRKINATGPVKRHVQRLNSIQDLSKHRFRSNPHLVKQINEKQKSWTATVYPDWGDLSLLQALRMMGGERSRIASRPRPASITKDHLRAAAFLPSHFDWRNVQGQNFVSPVRAQGGCGSCYAFASTGMLEARTRILSNNTQTPIFSPMDVVQCSEYSQGCDGGFPYLIAGKYAEDFGMVLEEANPYNQTQNSGSLVSEESRAESQDGVCKAAMNR